MRENKHTTHKSILLSGTFPPLSRNLLKQSAHICPQNNSFSQFAKQFCMSHPVCPQQKRSLLSLKLFVCSLNGTNSRLRLVGFLSPFYYLCQTHKRDSYRVTGLYLKKSIFARNQQIQMLAKLRNSIVSAQQHRDVCKNNLLCLR